jgi:hypothetical protein
MSDTLRLKTGRLRSLYGLSILLLGFFRLLGFIKPVHNPAVVLSDDNMAGSLP